MDYQLRDNAREHGIAVADSVAAKIQFEGMAPARAAELLNAYIIKTAEFMLGQGVPRHALLAWIRAVEAAFDERLSELVDQIPPTQ